MGTSERAFHVPAQDLRVDHRYQQELQQLPISFGENPASLCAVHRCVRLDFKEIAHETDLKPAGVYLTTLTFINDGAEDKLAGNMINFRKRQKAAEVIQDIKRWQSKPYNFQTVASVLTYLEESFQSYQDGVDYGDQFWNLSLEREPREREDEKMARLLQESGFL